MLEQREIVRNSLVTRVRKEEADGRATLSGDTDRYVARFHGTTLLTQKHNDNEERRNVPHAACQANALCARFALSVIGETRGLWTV